MKWPEATSIPDCTVDTIITAFFNKWISRYGTPATITTDRGAQFESALFETLIKLIGSRRIRITAYHPQSNRIIEGWHRLLKEAIKCHQTQNWAEVLLMALLGLRTSYKENIQASAAELVYGITLPGEYFTFEDPIGCPQTFVEKLRERMRQVRGLTTAHLIKHKTFIHKDLEDATHVFVRVDRLRGPLELKTNSNPLSSKEQKKYHPLIRMIICLRKTYVMGFAFVLFLFEPSLFNVQQ